MKWLYQSFYILSSIWLFHTSSLNASDNLHLSEVESGIFVFQGVSEQISAANLGAIGNSGFIVGRRAVAVIDPGGSLESGMRLKRSIEEVTNLPVEFLVLTHFHPDHVAGAMAFPDVSNVIAHEQHARAITQRAQFYIDRFAEILKGDVADIFRLPTQAVLTGESLTIDLGERTLVIEAHTVAHTDNDITVHDLDTNTLWASDLVFGQRTPALDGSLKGWLDVLSVLDERGYGLTIPGHGSPAPWSVLLAPQEAYLRRLHDDVKVMIDEGIALSVVLERHDAEKDKNSSWALYAAQHGSNIAKAYAELEWD